MKRHAISAWGCPTISCIATSTTTKTDSYNIDTYQNKGNNNNSIIGPARKEDPRTMMGTLDKANDTINTVPMLLSLL